MPKFDPRPTILFTLSLLLALLFVLAPADWAPASAETDARPPAPAAETTAGSSPNAKGQYPGIYVFLDNHNVDPAQYPWVTGGNMIFRWYDIEPADDFWDWSEVDEWLEEQSSLGKPAGIGFTLYDGRCCGGSRLPRWLPWEDESTVIRCGPQQWPIPRYDHPLVLAEYREYIQEFARRYDGDPRIAWIELGTGIFGESKPADTSDWPCLLDAGLTFSVWFDTVQTILGYYAEAFPQTPLLYQYAPVYVPEPADRTSQRKWLTDIAAGMGIGLKHNGLVVEHESATVDYGYTYDGSGHYDPMFAWWQDVPIAWETYGTQYCGDPSDTSRNATLTMWCFYNGLNKHPDYMVLSADLVTDPARRASLEFTAPYLGVELEETDSVWVVLREAHAGLWQPQYGNFDFWLYQNDDVPGGRSVPVWDKTSAPEGLFTRRTDAASGNPNLYFNVEDDWLLNNTNSQVMVEVVYLDEGADTWALFYDAVGNSNQLAEIVQKTNTGQWLTRTITLNDAYFGNRQRGGGEFSGSDFFISSNGSDDFFHRLRLFKAGTTPTPTPAPIGTATPAPPTPGSEPQFVRLRQGIDGYQGTEDTWIGYGCRDGDPADTTTPHGDEPTLYMRADSGGNDVCNSLYRFDLSVIPPGSDILSARLVLKGVSQSNAARLYFNTYDAIKPWDAATATWYNAATGLPWDQPGGDGPGDHPLLPLDIGIFSGPAEVWGWGGAYITPLVQRWLDNPYTNLGLYLRSWGSPVTWEVAASEYSIERFRPALEIRYWPPEGTTVPATVTPTSTPTPSPTATATATVTPTPSATPSVTPTPTSTLTPTLTPSPTATPTPTLTPTPTPEVGAVEGWVFHDGNGNGQMDDGEEGINGVVLTLSDNGGGSDTTTTEANGYFHFRDLSPAVYILTEEPPSGWSAPNPTDRLGVLISANYTQQVYFGHQPLPTVTSSPTFTPTATPLPKLWLPLYQR